VNQEIVTAEALADLVVDVWRIGRRAAAQPATPVSVVLAVERAAERLADMGFSAEDPVGQPYDPNMRVRVTHREGGDLRPMISECMAPAVFFRGRDAAGRELIRPAEVVVKGGEDGPTDC
jgi:hypothetical protein